MTHALTRSFSSTLARPRRWEGFHHAWATMIAQQLNQDVLPPEYYAESEISVGPELEIDVATLEMKGGTDKTSTAVWAPAKAKLSVPVDFARLDTYEVRVYQDLGGAELRAAIELISPANKDRKGSRQTFAAKCAGYLKHGIGLIIVDIVTDRSASLHRELFDMLDVKNKKHWRPATGLYAVAYRAVTVRKNPRIEVWPETLALGKELPELPLWLSHELAAPVRLEASYLETCRALRISA